jgi:hypothetical protein
MRGRKLALGVGILLAAGAAWAGPTPGSVDTDGDGVENVFDNCTLIVNPTQTDTDHNGCGDACQPPITCDAAADMDLVVGGPDQAVIGLNFGMVVPPGTMGDCTGDGVVGGADLATFGQQFLNMVGPSGITNAACDPETCLCTPQ